MKFSDVLESTNLCSNTQIFSQIRNIEKCWCTYLKANLNNPSKMGYHLDFFCYCILNTKIVSEMYADHYMDLVGIYFVSKIVTYSILYWAFSVQIETKIWISRKIKKFDHIQRKIRCEKNIIWRVIDFL